MGEDRDHPDLLRREAARDHKPVVRRRCHSDRASEPGDRRHAAQTAIRGDSATEAGGCIEPDARLRGARSDKRAALDELRARYEAESTVAKSIEGWNRIVFSDGSPTLP